MSIVAALACAALTISLVTIIGESDTTREQVCLYVNGILDAFHTPRAQASAQNIRAHYPALDSCHHRSVRTLHK